MAIEIVFEVGEIPELDPDALLDELESVLKNKSKRGLQTMFKQTVKTWSNKPRFTGKYTRKRDELRMRVKASNPNADQYQMVSHGTKPHPITARNFPTLSFRRGYKPATRPGRLKAARAYRFGKRRSPIMVDHPGSKPREFDKLVAKSYNPIFQRDMKAAVKRTRFWRTAKSSL